MNTVSVPRPIPLVQSNLSIPLTSGQSFTQATGYTIANEQGLKGKVDGITSHSVQNADLVLQEMAVEEALNNPEMQSLMQAQIAELNRQQEDARRRLLDLLDSQRVRQKQMQGQFVTDTEMDTSIRKEMGWQSNIQKVLYILYITYKKPFYLTWYIV
uniref:Uncharacterized protein n=2 Tax=Arion vulgaris TaxID=1028688 RepID=A0A0B7B997_9EUPU